MNNEIKETLKLLNDDEYNYISLDRESCKLLLDYITNLQQTYEKAIKQSKVDHIYASQKEDEAIDYKTRVDKAIEYINENILISFDKVGFKKDIVAGIVVNDLLNILEGSDKE